MGTSIPDKKHHMRMIGTLEEYEYLTEIDTTALTSDQQEYLCSRISTLELEARIRSTLPYEVKQKIYRYLLTDAEPIDITRLENQVAPAYYTDPHAEFDYWRLTPFVYATDNIHDAVITSNAHEFVENVLLDPTHMARFHTLDPPKQIIYEVLIRWDFVPMFLPEISLPNVESLFDLLHVLNGEPNRINLKFLFKDIRVVYDRSPSSKKEIAPDNKGRLRIMKAKMLDLLQTAMLEYHDCLSTPSTVSPLRKWGKYMKRDDAMDPEKTDAVKYKKQAPGSITHFSSAQSTIFHNILIKAIMPSFKAFIKNLFSALSCRTGDNEDEAPPRTPVIGGPTDFNYKKTGGGSPLCAPIFGAPPPYVREH
ncbi:hypothetical protein QM012_003407 [Aureobasidium pullulans]|uniref:Uncharacterized protein n=1 Tax=Aureobasidium pullulans TaxID=5580 RepID=A0ABR0T993_AURPU